MCGVGSNTFLFVSLTEKPRIHTDPGFHALKRPLLRREEVAGPWLAIPAVDEFFVESVLVLVAMGGAEFPIYGDAVLKCVPEHLHPHEISGGDVGGIFVEVGIFEALPQGSLTDFTEVIQVLLVHQEVVGVATPVVLEVVSAD